MKKFVIGHQLTDVQIIGGGVIGLSTALELRSAGLTVTVLEKGRIGRGSASWAGGGLLAPLCPDGLDHLSRALLVRSLKRYPEWCAALMDASGIDPEYLLSGLTIHDPELWNVWRQYAQWIGTDFRTGTGDAMIENGGARPVGHLSGVAQIRNPRLLKALAIAARVAGVRILEGQHVRRLGDGGVVRTRSGRSCAKVTVLAAGCWSQKLFAEMRIRPVKGQMLLLDGRGLGLESVHLAGGHYLIPRRDGKVLAGSTLEQAGFDMEVTSAARNQILQRVSGISAELARAPVLAQWAGLRPAAANPSPIIRWARTRRDLFLLGGHYRLGLTLAPASAELARRKILRAM